MCIRHSPAVIKSRLGLLFIGMSAAVFLLPDKKAANPSDSGDASATAITLTGASQFDEQHAFTRTLRKFEELVKSITTHRSKSGSTSVEN